MAEDTRVEIRDVTNHVGTYSRANFAVWVVSRPSHLDMDLLSSNSADP